MTDLTFMYTAYTIIGLLGTYIAISGQHGMFGVKLFFHKMRHKSNSGLLFLVNKAGNFGIPKLVDLSQETYTEKKGGLSKDWPISREQLQKGTFWGKPFIMYNVDDVKTNIGIYYQKCDKEGKPLFHPYEDKKGNKKIVPTLSPLAPSVSLSPSWLDALVGDKALTQALKQLFNKHRTLIYILGGIGIAVAFSAYVSYELTSTHIPAMMAELRELKEAVSAGVEFRP